MFHSTVISLACASIVFLYCVGILEVLLVWKEIGILGKHTNANI